MHNDEIKVQVRRDTSDIWNHRDPILLEGEFGYDITNKILKIGNGINSWKNLPFIKSESTDLQARILLEDHINNFNNPHQITPDQIPDGIDYALFFENQLQ